jgi:hypothetical protein
MNAVLPGHMRDRETAVHLRQDRRLELSGIYRFEFWYASHPMLLSLFKVSDERGAL